MRKRKLFGRPLENRTCHQTPRWVLGISLAAALGAAPAAARAGTEVRELSVRPEVTLPVTVGLAAAWVGSERAKDSLAPDTCRWCGSVPGIDRAARDAWRWQDPAAADTASDILDFAVIPAVVLGGDALLASRHGALSGWDEDALVILEAAMVASVVNQVVKFGVARERPFVHALGSPEEKAATEHPSDNDLSFYSGHTSLAFALAGAGGSVAVMRGYRHGWVVWPAAGALAAGVGYLRIGADKHWLTDVATGALVGSAIGVGVPYLLHAPKEGRTDSPLSLRGRASAAIAPGPRFVIAFAF